jgi:hypothetical protein
MVPHGVMWVLLGINRLCCLVNDQQQNKHFNGLWGLHLLDVGALDLGF